MPAAKPIYDSVKKNTNYTGADGEIFELNKVLLVDAWISDTKTFSKDHIETLIRDANKIDTAAREFNKLQQIQNTELGKEILNE